MLVAANFTNPVIRRPGFAAGESKKGKNTDHGTLPSIPSLTISAY